MAWPLLDKAFSVLLYSIFIWGVYDLVYDVYLHVKMSLAGAFLGA